MHVHDGMVAAPHRPGREIERRLQTRIRRSCLHHSRNAELPLNHGRHTKYRHPAQCVMHLSDGDSSMEIIEMTQAMLIVAAALHECTVVLTACDSG